MKPQEHLTVLKVLKGFNGSINFLNHEYGAKIQISIPIKNK